MNSTTQHSSSTSSANLQEVAEIDSIINEKPIRSISLVHYCERFGIDNICPISRVLMTLIENESIENIFNLVVKLVQSSAAQNKYNDEIDKLVEIILTNIFEVRVRIKDMRKSFSIEKQTAVISSLNIEMIYYKLKKLDSYFTNPQHSQHYLDRFASIESKVKRNMFKSLIYTYVFYMSSIFLVSLLIQKAWIEFSKIVAAI